MRCMSYSACVVKPVMVLPLTMDLPVVGSMMPGKIAAPWHLHELVRFLGQTTAAYCGFYYFGGTYTAAITPPCVQISVAMACNPPA